MSEMQPESQGPPEVSDFMPMSWWRAIDANGNILAETSDPEDFESLGLSDNPGVIFQRLYETKSSKWVEEKP